MPKAEPSSPAKPAGKPEVMRALIDATTELIIERGMTMSVRDIAARAGVNHGLIHTYFGTKEALLTSAFDDVQQRAFAECDSDGFPPPDLASHRNAELAKALSRVMLEPTGDPFPERRITGSWRRALATLQPEMPDDEVDERVIMAASLSLGYALFADHLSTSMQISEDQRSVVDSKVAELVAEIGGIPDADARSETTAGRVPPA